MARTEHLTIGPSPAGEDCAQVGSPDYAKQARKECTAFVNQLRRQFGEEPDGASLRIKSNPHDFGSYYEVGVDYDPDDEAAVAYALKVEREAPEEWDAEAQKELKPPRPAPKPRPGTVGAVLASKQKPAPAEKRWIGPIPNCDFCQTSGTVGGFIDGKTNQGPWAHMCRPCHAKHGLGIGRGVGQEYDRTGVKVAG
jgi:hypothetical protein